MKIKMKPRYKIKEVREALKMSQEELSQKAGVSRTTISGLESGRVTAANTDTLFKIATALGNKPNDIFLA